MRMLADSRSQSEQDQISGKKFISLISQIEKQQMRTFFTDTSKELYDIIYLQFLNSSKLKKTIKNHTKMNKQTSLFTRLFVLVLCLGLSAVGAMGQINLASWDLVGYKIAPKTGTVSAAPVTTKDARITVSNLALAASRTNIDPGQVQANAIGWQNHASATLAAAITNNAYLEFTVTPTGGNTVTITSLDVALFCNDGQENTFYLFSSKNGFLAANVMGVGVKNSGNLLANFPITGHVGLTTAVTFRIYISNTNPAGSDGSFAGIGNRLTGTADLIVNGSIPDVNAPSVPAGLVASNIFATGFTINWNPSTDDSGSVASYEVFRGGTTSLGVVTTGTSLSVTGLTASTSYSITVKAKDLTRNVSAASTAKSVTTTTVDAMAPSAPTNLVVSNILSNSCLLTWTASTDNSGTVASYEVFRAGTISCGTTTTNSMTVSGLAASSSYSFTVKAKDPSGNVSVASIATSLTTTALSASERNHVGLNLSVATDYDDNRIFADVFKVSREWMQMGMVTPAAVDAKGWPTTDAEKYVWAGIGKMNGTYKLSFTGKATLAGNSLTVQNQVYNAGTNSTTADLIYTNADPSDSYLQLSFTGTTGGVKDVKMMKPLSPGSTQSYAASEEFTTELRNILAKVECVRTLQTTGTTFTTVTADWAQRTFDDYHWPSYDRTGFGWGGHGISWETNIRLCNAMNVDAMICVPIAATDDYITQLATLWKNNLNPGLKVYVELSNELWNNGGDYVQTPMNHTMAVAEVGAGGSSLNFDGETGEWQWAWRRVAKRTVEMSNLWRAVVGDVAMMSTIRPILMWQQSDGQGTAFQDLVWLDYYSQLNNKPINYYIYAAGGSGYYNPQNDSPSLTIDNIWGSDTFAPASFAKNMKIDATIVAAMGVKKVAYEGGPSMDNLGFSEDVKAVAVSDPRMKDCVIQHHDVWSNCGGDLLVYYRATDNYQWGFTQDVYNLNTPKYQALDQINAAAKAPVNIGVTVPVTEAGVIIAGTAFDQEVAFWSASALNPVWKEYLINVTTDGRYDVTMSYTGAAAATAKINIDGGQSLTAIVLPAASGTTDAITFNFTTGLHSVRVITAAGNLTVSNVKIKKSVATDMSSSQLLGNKLVVYPNPALDQLTLDFGTAMEVAAITILDLQGRTVISKSVANATLETLDVSSLHSGIYFVKVTANGAVMNSKFVKQ